MIEIKSSTGYFRYVTLKSEISSEGVLVWLDYGMVWFKRRFSMFQDILRESPIYQELVEQGLEKGIQGQREMLLGFVQMRFPELLALAKQRTEGITDPDLLPSMSHKLFAAQTLEEARRILLGEDGG
jgi:hypothetical protein